MLRCATSRERQALVDCRENLRAAKISGVCVSCTTQMRFWIVHAMERERSSLALMFRNTVSIIAGDQDTDGSYGQKTRVDGARAGNFPVQFMLVCVEASGVYFRCCYDV